MTADDQTPRSDEKVCAACTVLMDEDRRRAGMTKGDVVRHEPGNHLYARLKETAPTSREETLRREVRTDGCAGAYDAGWNAALAALASQPAPAVEGLDVERLARVLCDVTADGNPKLGGVPWKYRTEDERNARRADASLVAQAYLAASQPSRDEG